MVILFGDSWARQSWQHSKENINNGYQHWSLDNTWVINTDDWLNHYFKKSLTVNFARFGNTLDWINRDLFHSLATVSNLPDQVDFVVFQTDPLRIFAPRLDYTDVNVVWPNFLAWCTHSEFDWKTKSLDDLLSAIYRAWYRDLNSFQYIIKNSYPNKQMQLWLLGGVSDLHQTIEEFKHRTIMPSVSRFFGLTEDCCLENRSSLACLIEFWCTNLTDSDHQHRLREQWQLFDNLISGKEEFWIDNPKYFAGRHMTSLAMQELAEHIEHVIYSERKTWSRQLSHS